MVQLVRHNTLQEGKSYEGGREGVEEGGREREGGREGEGGQGGKRRERKFFIRTQL